MKTYKLKGFLLIEVLFSILIFSLFVSTIKNMFQYIHSRKIKDKDYAEKMLFLETEINSKIPYDATSDTVYINSSPVSKYTFYVKNNSGKTETYVILRER